jgi:hypothetical protein
MNGTAPLPWPPQFTAYLGYVPGGGDYEWASDHVLSELGAVMTYGSTTIYSAPGLLYFYAMPYDVVGKTFTQSVTEYVGTDIFTGHLEFESGSTLKLGNNSTWARNITVGTAS